MEGENGAQGSTPAENVQTGEANSRTPGNNSGGVSNTQNSNGNVIKDAAQEVMRKLKLKKDDGTEEEVDEAEVLRVYKDRTNHQKAANKELQEGKAARAQAKKFAEMLRDKNQLFEVISRSGHKPQELVADYLKSAIKDQGMRKMVEDILGGQLQVDLMDPKDRRLMEYEEKERADKELEKKRQDSEAAEHRRLASEKLASAFETKFVEALQSSTLPKTKESISRMAGYVKAYAAKNIKIEPIEAAKLVEEDYQNIHKTLISESDGEALLKLLGDEAAAKILEARGKKVKTPTSELTTPEIQTERQKRDKSRRMSHKEWRAYNRK